MKRRILRHKFALGLITALALASCSQDELSDGGQGTPLPAGKYSLTLTASSIGETVATPATRSTVENKWDGGETVYVQVYDNYASGELQWGNATMQTYTVAQGGTMNKTDGNDVYWQASGEKKAIRAWYVGGNTAKTGELPSSHTVKTDQNGDGYAQSDFLYAGCISGFSDGKDGVSLQFYHQVAKVNVQIVRGEDTPANFSVTGLTIGGVATQGTYTAPQISENNDDNPYGTWSNIGEGKDITPHKAEDKSGDNADNLLATYEAIVIPQTVNSSTKLFTITAEGYSDFAYTTTAEKEWEPGKEYTYTITIKGNKLEVSVSGGNINWGKDGATGSGSVILPPTEINLGNDPVNITDDGDYLITGSGTQTVTINGNATVIFRDVNITTSDGASIHVTGGNPKLQFSGKNTLTCGEKGGIMAENGANINIQGNGEANSSLTIKGINDNPQIGIGSGRDLKCGDITINDILLDIATDYGSGIGTSINSTCGNINLANCKLNIITTSNAVCIGASTGNKSFSSQCGNIVLRNCDMTGKAGNWYGAFPAAIGSRAINASCGNIDIYLRENETVNDFIAELTVPDGVDKVGKGNNYSGYGEPSHGEITWYNHEGKQIDSGAKK